MLVNTSQLADGEKWHCETLALLCSSPEKSRRILAHTGGDEVPVSHKMKSRGRLKTEMFSLALLSDSVHHKK